MQKKTKLLIKRFGGIGDVIMTTCLLDYLKDDYEIYYQTKYPSIFYNNHLVKGVYDVSIDINKVSKKFDKIIDLNWKLEAEGIGEGVLTWNDYISINRIDLILREAGIKKQTNDKINLHYYPLKEEVRFALDIWNSLKGKKGNIIYQIASISPIRTMPIEKTIYILKKLLEMDYNVIVVGHCMQWRHLDFVRKYYDFVREVLNLKYNGKNFIDLTDRLTLRLTLALIYTCDIGIFIDSGLLYFCAGAFKKPTIAIFGNIKPELRIKYYPFCVSVFPNEKDVKCKNFPCFDPCPPPCPNYEVDIVKKHKIGALCMDAIDASELLIKVAGF